MFAATRGGTKIDPSKLAKVEKGDLAKSVVATGKVTPITKVEVKSKASGIVKKLYVDYGDQVKKGQLLAQLDKIEIEAQVEQSRAALEAAQANLKSSAGRLRARQGGCGRSGCAAAEARLRPRHGDGERRSGFRLGPRRCAEELRAGREQAERLARRRSPCCKAKIAQAQAQVAQDQANLKQLEEQLSYTDIISPIDGIVLSRDVEMGDAVSSILVLGSSAPRW